MKPLESMAVFNHPYSVGVLLAVNAIPDAFLLLDAPECGQWRPGWIHGSHDSTSTLWDPEGKHRMQASCTSTDRIIKGNHEDLERRLKGLAGALGCGAVLAAGFPMARISGASYETIWRSLKPVPAVPFFQVRGGAISHDWLDGYAHTLAALARGMDLPSVERRPEDVAIVGYMHDRGERDHAANIAELRRMLAAIGLNLVSVWLGGVRFGDLAAAACAGTVVSLPYGREAADILAERLGARLVDCGLPLGLNASAEWLVRVGTAVGRKAEAESFSERELGRVAPRFAWAVEEFFVQSRFAFAGDPVLLRPVARQLSELGGRVETAFTMGGPHHGQELGAWGDLPFPVQEALPLGLFKDALAGLISGPGQVHGLIGSGFIPIEGLDCLRPIQIGFPSYFSHAFHDRPFLGFEGAACLLNRVADELCWRRNPLRSDACAG